MHFSFHLILDITSNIYNTSIRLNEGGGQLEFEQHFYLLLVVRFHGDYVVADAEHEIRKNREAKT